jgi:hypothetical protein
MTFRVLLLLLSFGFCFQAHATSVCSAICAKVKESSYYDDSQANFIRGRLVEETQAVTTRGESQEIAYRKMVQTCLEAGGTVVFTKLEAEEKGHRNQEYDPSILGANPERLRNTISDGRFITLSEGATTAKSCVQAELVEKDGTIILQEALNQPNPFLPSSGQR